MVGRCDSVLLDIRSLSLEQGLRRWLEAAIALLQADVNAVGDRIGEGALPPIPLKQTKQKTVQFVSAIAFRLEAPRQQPALAIAQRLADALQQVLHHPQRHPIPESWMQWYRTVDVEVEAPGWLFLRPRDESLALWLQWLLSSHWEGSIGSGKPSKEPLSHPERFEEQAKRKLSRLELRSAAQPRAWEMAESIWEMQATYARCCSLLRLAEAQGIVELTTALPRRLSVAQPCPVPWLRGDRRLQLQTSIEQQLLSQLVHTVTVGASPDYSILPETFHSVLFKQGYTLHQTFQQFDSICRIFGDVSVDHRELAQSRLGLVATTGLCLQGLLEQELGVEAAMSL